MLRFCLLAALILSPVALAHSHHPAPATASSTKAAPQPSALISGAYVAAMPPVAKDTAAYFTLRNTGKTSLTITGATSEVSGSSMLMTFKPLSNGELSMQMVNSFTLKPGQRLTLTPSGNHVMLTDLKRPLKVGEQVKIKLHVAGGGVLNFSAPVKKF